jgi:hypothetical protein
MFEDPTKTKKYLKIALWGKGGTGKTRFALSFPSPCVVDSEHGTDPYVGKYVFKVKHISRWRQLEPALRWLREHPGVFETLVIDSGTLFYTDLINDIVDYIKSKRGNEIMTRGDWGVEKRKWKALLVQLIELPMHIILAFHGKDAYEDTVGKNGEEVSKKTGEEYPEADKQTEFLFDLGFRCFTEEDKKAKKSKFLIQCVKTRYDWMPKYAIHNVTGMRPYDGLFKEHVQNMLAAPDAPAAEAPAEPLVVQEPATVPSPATVDDPVVEPIGPAKGAVEHVGEILETFAGGDPNAPAATLEDIKLLMVRCSKLTWPDGSPFKSAEGKKLIKALYKLESTKDLRKYQFEFLYREFGEVLSGRARLVLEERGVPYVERMAGALIEPSSK